MSRDYRLTAYIAKKMARDYVLRGSYSYYPATVGGTLVAYSLYEQRAERAPEQRSSGIL
jgi:hypothetical protein